MRSAFPPNPWGDRSRRKVGLLGGSFNPAHDGHRYISLAALRSLRLDEVWWLVAPQNPLKPVKGMAKQAERLAGARAVARHPGMRVTDIETRLGTHFTVDTLELLRQRFPRAHFVWLMGADNLIQMPAWRRWRRIFAEVSVAVIDRAPYSYPALAGKAAHRLGRARRAAREAGILAATPPPAWVFLRWRRHPASATAIRQGEE